MTSPGDNLDAELVTLLQRGIPLEKRPFKLIGGELGLTGEEMLSCAQSLLDEGTARRFGAVFDSRSLGYNSTLCAVDVPEEDIENAAGILTPDPGVTHCYQRDGDPNLWFTVTAPAGSFDVKLDAMAKALAPYELLDLPAIRRFKVEAVFDVRGSGQSSDTQEQRQSAPKGCDPVVPLTEHERRVVRGLQGNVPLSIDPFRELASELDCDHGELLLLLKHWKQAGVLRRVGLIMRHRELGFVANSMCVWRVEEGEVEKAGYTMAAHREVSHCYERPYTDRFPFNLYAMVHAAGSDELRNLFERLSEETGLANGRMMVSVREFKKSSPVFFCESGHC